MGVRLYLRRGERLRPQFVLGHSQFWGSRSLRRVFPNFDQLNQYSAPLNWYKYKPDIAESDQVASKHKFTGHARFSKRSDAQLVDFHEFYISKLPPGTQTCLGHGGFWENQPLPRNCHPHPVPRVLLWVVGIFPGSLGRQASQKWKISNMAAVLGALVTGWRMAFWRCPKSGYPNSWMVSIKDNPIFIMEKYEEYSGTVARSRDINGYSGQIIATSGTKAWNQKPGIIVNV